MCVPSGGGDCGSGIRVSVSRGDRIFTLLSVAHDPNLPVSQWPTETLATDVAWDPTITYDTAASNAALREPYNASIYQFEQATDFAMAGNPPAPWVAHSGGTVHISGALTKGTTSEDVTIKITHIPANNDFCTAAASMSAKVNAPSLAAPGAPLARVAVNGILAPTSSAGGFASNTALAPTANPNLFTRALSPNSASTTAVFSETYAGDTSFNSQAIISTSTFSQTTSSS